VSPRRFSFRTLALKGSRSWPTTRQRSPARRPGLRRIATSVLWVHGPADKAAAAPDSTAPEAGAGVPTSHAVASARAGISVRP
jgi:hypothetical protein